MSVSDCGRTRLHSPSVVLSVEQEVRTHDGDTHSHDTQDDQDQHHEAVHIVDFVGPKRCEDEVPEERGKENMSPAANIILWHTNPAVDLHFDENGAEWKDSSEADDDSRLHEPERSQESTYEYDCDIAVYRKGFTSDSPCSARIHDLLCCERGKGKSRHRKEIQANPDSGLKSHLPFPIGSLPQGLAEGCKC